MFRSRSRAESLANHLIAEEPAFADQKETLVALFEGDISPTALPDAFVASRRRRTEAIWSDGRAAWNRFAAGRLKLMRRAGGDAALVSAFQEIFAADFGGRTFARDLDVADAIFPGHVVLDHATIGGSLRLDHINAMAEVRAEGVRVAREITGEQSQFVGPVKFDGARISGAMRLSHSLFASDVHFDGVSVEREMWLRHATFNGVVQIRSAIFARDVSLGAMYGGIVILSGTRFEDTVSMEDAEFREGLDISGCQFDGILILDHMSLRGPVFMGGARFAGVIRPNLEVLSRFAADGSDWSNVRPLRR